MSKTWGKIGAWAADVEAAEAEELAAAASTYPTLSQAATVASKQKKKTKMSLHEFTMSSASPGLTTAEMLRLPTRPQERSAYEYPSRDSSWGGGRRSYGGGYENDDHRASNPSRVSNSDNSPNMPDLPSRADEADNWAMGKKNVPSYDSGRPSKYNSLGGGGRTDDVDTWGAGKRAPFRNPVGPGATERPRLVLNPPKKEVGSGLELIKASTKPSPFGAARPREEVLAEKGLDWKKLELDIEVKKSSSSSSRPTSSHSSRPTSSHSNRSEGVGVDGAVKAKPKVNPFGDAKPREVLLEEKGLDWRKIDLELDHRRVDRLETEGEKILKEEINHLKQELAKQSALNSTTGSHEGATADLHDMILSKENDLELLIHELDNKVRFCPRIGERPGSGAGRVSGPPPRSESFHEPRNMEFMERPRSRGTGDMFSRQNDDRRAFQGGMDRGGFVGNRGMDRQRDDGRFFQGGMERGFMGHRGMDRPRSRERW